MWQEEKLAMEPFASSALLYQIDIPERSELNA